MARDPATEADAALMAQLSERGMDVTARQLRRWRLHGVIPSPVRVAGGRGRGLRSIAYPTGTVDRAAGVGALIEAGRSFQEVVLELLWDGEDLPMPTVRSALERLVLDAFAEVYRRQPDMADAEDAGNIHARTMLPGLTRTDRGREWIGRAQTYGARSNSVLETALASILSMFLGVIDNRGANTEAMAQVFGFPHKLADDAIDIMGITTAPEVLRLLSTATLGQIREATLLAHDYYTLTGYLHAHSTVPLVVPAFADEIDQSAVQRGITIIHAVIIEYWLPDFAESVRTGAEEVRTTGELGIIDS